MAVGVLDLMPHAVSSVYLFYDPDYGHHDWGKISALREIALAIEGGYEFYYMGYYIHSCVKMRYKGRYQPTSVLDPETYEWNLLDQEYRSKLDHRLYYSPSRDRTAPPSNDDSTASTTIAEPAVTSTTKSASSKFADDEELELDEPDPAEDDAEIPEGSLFNYNIPGVLTKEELAGLDLAHWKLVVRNMLIDLEVSRTSRDTALLTPEQDLRGWEEWQVDDPGSIKGIAAEVIACTGPKLLENSALVLF